MSLANILLACLGGGSNANPQAPYLSAQEASQLPLDTFVHRSLECAPSVLEQSRDFVDIFQGHMQRGASSAQVARIVRESLSRMGGAGASKATVDWACQMLMLASQEKDGGNTESYRPPQVAGGSYAQVAGSGNGGWETPKQQQHKQQQQQQQSGGDVYIKSFFFPSEDSFAELINFLDSAKTSLDICVFNITDNDLARAIGNAKKRGVNVRIITDDEQLKCQGNDVERLSEQHGIPFKTDSDPQKFMHSKFAVIDRRAVWAGSYNWTVGARRSNNESVIVTNDSRTAQAFSGEFERLWSQF
ncbi:hypothetical protein GGI01_001161 [Coemansia sp. RSA 376]|nr:hypothetical protein GGI14_002064 [Coemansia sp. S680]KAJ2041570.1 hypothetical protein H4S04_007655 [Coemansia sp. S16]KAJ2100037.1 hypothetical protein GGI09_002478 [Coemansia sp. S100]KAJ2107655.1 hypothetical protein IW146_007213 [Coemansia sp. RSA 922]KAJ2262924.1 hypothetical protein GGI01_001161 [Coemansia sp. RSA 376]